MIYLVGIDKGIFNANEQKEISILYLINLPAVLVKSKREIYLKNSMFTPSAKKLNKSANR